MDVARPAPALLEVRNLATEFATAWGPFRAVDGVSFSVAGGRTLGIVGESGCGKSVTSLSVMRLLPPGIGRVVAGEVLLNGQELLRLDDETMRTVRGRSMAMIFQEPMTSLNPVMRVGDQVSESVRFYRGLSRRDARALAVELLGRVGIPSPQSRVEQYPHQLSGGMRQRVMIAMALAARPALLIADEPTTALDVTIQAQILALLRKLQAEDGMGIVLITHDLGVVAEMAQEVAVMYAGQIVERGPVELVFGDPLHPYAIGLLGSVARLDRTQSRLDTIPGQVPGPGALFAGCRFAERCPFADRQCREAPPPLSDAGRSHLAACWKAPL
ncbi:MAG: ABC transporter ATP-binding protein [Reyranellaceae bacterium]